MIQTILNIVFIPFSFDPVLLACGFSCTLGILGLVRRFIVGDWNFVER